MGIKLYNKLPEENKKSLQRAIILKKKAEIKTFAKCFLYFKRIFTGSNVVDMCIGNWGK